MEKRISVAHLWLIFLLAVASVLLVKTKPVEDDHHFLAPPPEHLEHFTFGFAEMMSDSLWLRWIQDSDTCQTYASAIDKNPIQPTQGEFANPRHRFCDNSWSFKMLDVITRVTPKFEMPYIAGAITLSVLVEDYDGAKIIFDRGVENFPNDWHLLYRASYHYLYDRNDLPKAAELMLRAAKNGAPSWLNLLAAKLYSKAGQIEVGIDTLENFKKSLTDPKLIKDVDLRIEKLKKQRAAVE